MLSCKCTHVVLQVYPSVPMLFCRCTHVVLQVYPSVPLFFSLQVYPSGQLTRAEFQNVYTEQFPHGDSVQVSPLSGYSLYTQRVPFR